MTGAKDRIGAGMDSESQGRAYQEYQTYRAYIKEIESSGIHYGLDGMRSLMGHLDNVQDQLRIIHVAGTNGKGSVCAYLSAILQAQGYRVGTYVSPAVYRYEEIYSINGTPITPEAFVRAAEPVCRACGKMVQEGAVHPSAFEAETAIAFCFFAQEACDYVVLEAGMGGLEDATNLIGYPICSVLTAISRDHMAFLGETLEEIAAAKAGIIKPGRPCVSAMQKPEVLKVLREHAAAKGSSLKVADGRRIINYQYDAAGSSFDLMTGDFPNMEQISEISQMDQIMHVNCKMTGAFQKENLICAVEAAGILQEQGVRLTWEAVAKGLSGAYMPGRFQRVNAEHIPGLPDIYMDGAHNEDAARLLRETVQTCFEDRRLIYIMGVLADKEYDKVLRMMLPCAAGAVTVTPDVPRALPGDRLAEEAGKYHGAVTFAPKIREAVAQAIEAAGPEGVVLAFGSFSWLKELEQAVKESYDR